MPVNSRNRNEKNVFHDRQTAERMNVTETNQIRSIVHMEAGKTVYVS